MKTVVQFMPDCNRWWWTLIIQPQLVDFDWKNIKHLSTGPDSLLQKYETLIDELGTWKGVYAKLVVKPDAIPKFFKPHSVSCTFKEAIEQDLQWLQQLGVTEKVKVFGQHQS